MKSEIKSLLFQGSLPNFLGAPQSQRALQRCTKRLSYSLPILLSSKPSQNQFLLFISWYWGDKITWACLLSQQLELEFIHVAGSSRYFFSKISFCGGLPPLLKPSRSFSRSCLRSSKSWWNPKLKILLHSCEQICKDKVHHQSPYFSPIFRCASN